MVAGKKKPTPSVVAMTREEYDLVRGEYIERIKKELAETESEAERQKRIYREERAKARGETLAD